MPNNWLYSSIDNLCTAIANSSKFQEITGSEDATEAADYVHKWDADPDATVPLAIVFSSGGRTRSKTSTTGWTNRDGQIQFYFVHPVSAENQADPSAAGSAFAAILQTILNELEAQNGEHVNIIEFSELLAPTEMDADSDNGRKRWEAQISVTVK